MFIYCKKIAIPLLISRAIPLWQQVVVFPEKIRTVPETRREIELVELPDSLVECSVEELKAFLLETINTHFDELVRTELCEAIERVQAATNDTKDTRDSGKPQFHHVLMTTLLSWAYAHAYLKKNSFDARELLLICLYHDSVEDTEIFGTTDAGDQYNCIMDIHGESVGIGVGFLTKSDVRVAKKYTQFKAALLGAHFSGIADEKNCPRIVRFIKCCDRLANFSDFQFSPWEFFNRKHSETQKYFKRILSGLPPKFKALFKAYIAIQNTNYGGIFSERFSEPD